MECFEKVLKLRHCLDKLLKVKTETQSENTEPKSLREEYGAEEYVISS